MRRVCGGSSGRPTVGPNIVTVYGATSFNQDQVKPCPSPLAEWVYSALGSPFTIPAILVFYGLILIYLLVSVYNLGNTEVASTRRRRTRLVPYYNSEGQLKGWVREEKSQRPEATRTSHPQHKQTSSLPVPTPITAPAERNAASAPAKSTTPLPLPPASASAPAPLSLEYGTAFRMVASGAISRLNNWKTPRSSLSTGLGTGFLGNKVHQPLRHLKRAKFHIFNVPGWLNVQSECTCGLKLRHRLCKFEWSIILYSGGAVFESNYTHSHSRYTHSLSTPKSKPPQLQSFISRQPVSLILPQPSEPLNAESAESPATSVGQVNEGQQTRQHTPEPEPKPELGKSLY
ncbi:hypothetical protein R3P38DRAFT_2810689 [Favolaschia claudopus]|uniref:Uncharacterized protein n=1 Tax=Favolaschia claudopus TaxID=2862362 RepID=A0AAV9ZAE1_9AGAR